MTSKRIRVKVNESWHHAEVPVRLLLADFLRDYVGLRGTHLGCEHGTCGTCTVQLDGEPIRSCLLLAVQANGATVRTVEGLGPGGGTLHPLQEAFHQEHALQCGFCTPGFLVALDAFIRDADGASLQDEVAIRSALSGNLCRCTGYQPIVAAVRRAATAMRSADASESSLRRSGSGQGRTRSSDDG